MCRVKSQIVLEKKIHVHYTVDVSLIVMAHPCVIVIGATAATIALNVYAPMDLIPQRTSTKEKNIEKFDSWSQIRIRSRENYYCRLWTIPLKWRLNRPRSNVQNRLSGSKPFRKWYVVSLIFLPHLRNGGSNNERCDLYISVVRKRVTRQCMRLQLKSIRCDRS